MLKWGRIGVFKYWLALGHSPIASCSRHLKHYSPKLQLARISSNQWNQCVATHFTTSCKDFNISMESMRCNPPHNKLQGFQHINEVNALQPTSQQVARISTNQCNQCVATHLTTSCKDFNKSMESMRCNPPHNKLEGKLNRAKADFLSSQKPLGAIK